MVRPIRIDPAALASEVPDGLPIVECRRLVKDLICRAVAAATGSMRVVRPCKNCGKPLDLGGWSWDKTTVGRLTRDYCNNGGICKRAAKYKRRILSQSAKRKRRKK